MYIVTTCFGYQATTLKTIPDTFYIKYKYIKLIININFYIIISSLFSM